MSCCVGQFWPMVCIKTARRVDHRLLTRWDELYPGETLVGASCLACYGVKLSTSDGSGVVSSGAMALVEILPIKAGHSRCAGQVSASPPAPFGGQLD